MKFLVKYKLDGQIKECFIEAKDLDEAEEKANAKKLNWDEIRII